MSHGMPQPTEHHRKLSALAGSWSGPEKLYPSPWGPGGQATGKMSARLSVDSFFLLQDYEEEKDGAVVFRGHGVVGYDERDRSYFWYWFDSMGSPPPSPSRGKWDGDTLTFLSRESGRQSRYTYRFESPTRYSFRIEGSRDGSTWAPFVEASYGRD
ncbi:MAG TPA: DUF1579 family protein [Myxococcales bacterium]|nr:DUF1579 family protein [Myxococcales bacterium]